MDKQKHLYSMPSVELSPAEIMDHYGEAPNVGARIIVDGQEVDPNTVFFDEEIPEGAGEPYLVEAGHVDGVHLIHKGQPIDPKDVQIDGVQEYRELDGRQVQVMRGYTKAVPTLDQIHMLTSRRAGKITAARLEAMVLENGSVAKTMERLGIDPYPSLTVLAREQVFSRPGVGTRRSIRAQLEVHTHLTGYVVL